MLVRAPRLVHRTAHIRLRLTRRQASRCYGLLRSAGDVWAWLLDTNRQRHQQGEQPVTGYQALCRQLTSAGPFGELSVVGARSVLQRYSDAWCQAAKRRSQHQDAGFPRRKRALVRSAVTTEPSRSRANGCDCRSPRATRRYGCGWLARCRIRPSRSARRVRRAEARHRRRVHQAQHQAAKQVIAFAVQQRIGTLVVGDPKGITNRDVGRVQNLRLRRWRRTHLLQALSDKAEQAGMVVWLVDERGTSSTCPACQRRVPKPKGRDFGCPDCGFQGHRDLVGPAWPRATHQPLTGTVGVARHMQVCILGVARIKQRRPTGQTLPEGALVPPFGLLEPGLEGPSGAGDPDQQPLQVRQRPLARLGPGKPGRDPLVHTNQPSTSGMSSQARKSTSRSLRRSGAWTGTQWLTPSSRW
jgi:IS605 OrfB family transposase